MSFVARLGWVSVALAGAGSLGVVALSRGETISSTWFLVAALCTYALGYRFYSAFLAARALALDDARVTPAHRLADGKDFVPTNRWVVFGHHFAAIAGPGPLVGPILAAQFGYLPGTLWIVIGGVLGGAGPDGPTGCASRRRGPGCRESPADPGGRSVGKKDQGGREEAEELPDELLQQRLLIRARREPEGGVEEAVAEPQADRDGHHGDAVALDGLFEAEEEERVRDDRGERW